MSVMLLPAVDEDDMQRYIVAKSNQFILHSRYDLTLMEQRILACMISMIDSRSDELRDCELDIDTFCSLCKIEKRGSSKYLKEVTKGLRDQSFWMETEEGVYETFSWVEKVSINVPNVQYYTVEDAQKTLEELLPFRFGPDNMR